MRNTIRALLSILFVSASSAGAAPAATTPVAQAQALVMKKNRQEACVILNKALETPGGKARAALIETLHQISRVFFTDKGQQAFEAGQAGMWEGPDLALAQFRAALALEDGNVLVQNGIARVQLMKQDCDGALATLQAARKLDPFAGESAVLELRTYVCQQRSDLLREKAKTMPSLNKWEEAYVQYLLAQDSAQAKTWKKAYDVGLKLTEEYPGFPEGFLLLGRASTEMGKDGEIWLQKYVSLCKGLTTRERKQFALEPRLCAGLKEVDDELARAKQEM